MVRIRRAAPADAAALAALAECTFRETFAADNSPDDLDLHCRQNFGAEIQGREIADPQLITLLADVDGQPAGFAQLRPMHSSSNVRAERPTELHRIYVAGEWHGRGVAGNLMREVIAAAAQAGADCIWLGVWEHNPKALAFYRKFGFRVVGDHTFMLGKDRQRDLILAARLDDLASIDRSCAGS